MDNKTRLIIGGVLLAVVVVLILVVGGGERQPTADQIPAATTPTNDLGIKGLKLN